MDDGNDGGKIDQGSRVTISDYDSFGTWNVGPITLFVSPHQSRARGRAERREGPHSFAPPTTMRLKQLESLLEDVEPFREPNNELEQYPTGAHLAACVLAEAHARGDVEGRVVADLGVGGGVLAIASLLAGARRVVGVDVDPGALELCRDNCDAFDPALRPTLRLGSIPEDVARWNADPRAVAAADEADEEDETVPTPARRRPSPRTSPPWRRRGARRRDAMIHPRSRPGETEDRCARTPS